MNGGPAGGGDGHGRAARDGFAPGECLARLLLTRTIRHLMNTSG